jgi:hypothetical protein
MSFLRHPFYTLLAIATSAWLSVANGRGLSLVHTANPLNWAAGSGGYTHSTLGHSHSFSHMSHMSHK